MLVGDTDSFAIEIDVSSSSPYLMGHARLWVGSNFLGRYEEEIMIQPFVAVLKRIARREVVEDGRLSWVSPIAAHALIDGDYLLHDHCLPGFGESFDDFEVYIYRFGGVIR